MTDEEFEMIAYQVEQCGERLSRGETERMITEMRTLKAQLEALAEAYAKDVEFCWNIDLANGPERDALFALLKRYRKVSE